MREGNERFAVLNVPLIVVLGHDSRASPQCDAGGIGRRSDTRRVRARHRRTGHSIDPARRREGLTRVDEFEARHVTETAKQLVSRSRAIAEGVESGTLAIAGVTYQLADGRAVPRESIGDIGAG